MTYITQVYNQQGELVAERNSLLEAGLNINAAKAHVKADIERYAAELRRQAVGLASPPEMASWVKKESEAHEYQLSGNEFDAPLLAAEADARGVTLDSIVQRVLTNANVLNALEAAIAGTSGRHRDAVDLIDDINALAVYDWRTGWPSVTG